jgi:uncharacterized membrane protein
VTPRARQHPLAAFCRQHLKLVIAVVAGIVTFTVLPGRWSLISRILTGWNVTVLLLVPLTYIWMRRLDAKGLRARYEGEDPSAPIILLTTVAGALLSVAAIVALLATLNDVDTAQRAAHISLAALTIVDSWVLVHTMFTIHYADMYYSASKGAAPLCFPETAEPVFWDFVYFSFTIGVACQTADVATRATEIRRTVILHGVIAFIFNMSILGFAVNVSAGLLGGK